MAWGATLHLGHLPPWGHPQPFRLWDFSPAHHLCAACCDHLESGTHSTLQTLLVSLRSSMFLFCTQHTCMAACELSVFCCWVFYSTDPGESPSSCCPLLPRLDVTCFQRSVSTTEFSGDSQTADSKVGEPGRRKAVLPDCGGPA